MTAPMTDAELSVAVAEAPDAAARATLLGFDLTLVRRSRTLAIRSGALLFVGFGVALLVALAFTGPRAFDVTASLYAGAIGGLVVLGPSALQSLFVRIPRVRAFMPIVTGVTAFFGVLALGLLLSVLGSSVEAIAGIAAAVITCGALAFVNTPHLADAITKNNPILIRTLRWMSALPTWTWPLNGRTAALTWFAVLSTLSGLAELALLVVSPSSVFLLAIASFTAIGLVYSWPDRPGRSLTILATYVLGIAGAALLLG